MKILFTLICIFLPIFAAASITPYLKPALNKPENCVMRNIDYIYMINLDERPEKFERSFEQLNKYGITPYRFSAVNGWTLPLSTINALGVKYTRDMVFEEDHLATYFVRDGIGLPRKQLPWITKLEPMHTIDRTYFCRGTKLGTIGCLLSHLSVLYDAYNSGYETIWVMEDDIEIIKDPNILSDLISELDEMVGGENWDILFTDQNTKDIYGNYVYCFMYGWRPNYEPENPQRFGLTINLGKFKKIGARYGAYSMIVRRSAMKKLLDFITAYNVYLPYDFEYNLPNDIRLYTVRDDVISTLPAALSDNDRPGH